MSLNKNKIIFSALILMIALILCPVLFAAAEEPSVQASQMVQVGVPVEETPELFLTRSMPTRGEGKIAVFLIDFPDYKNNNSMATREYYDKLYFGDGEGTNWEDMTVAGFYREQSYGKLNISGQVFDWYTAKHERSYYDDRKAELVMEAAEYYRAQGVDFSQFDGDGDGVIDAIAYHFAGAYDTSPNQPWYSGLCYGGGINGFGKIGELKFTTMVQVGEDAREGSSELISTVCHELGHTLGMPDLYSDVLAGGFDDLMCLSTPTINPYTKILLGWIDTVLVVTGNMDNIRLDADTGKNPGDVVIVTDKYNGFFDEFYVVSYRNDGNPSGVIVWHVDARLNESKTAFLHNNFNYDPRPDTDKWHGTDPADVSKYPFIEQVYSDLECDCWINTPSHVNQTVFGEDSVLAPDQLPSSDTHDGKYTGIRMDNFKEDKELYATFDVSFVKDTSAPVVITKDGDLGFKKTIKLHFNENVYAGEGWDKLLVTDMDGKAIATNVKLSNYPHNELEITFETEDYRNGYKIVFPENCLCDSSGNGLKAETLTVSGERLFFPSKTHQLPNPGFNRNNAEAFFFQKNDSLVVITTLWENNNGDAKLEVMRLDYNGNVQKQVIVDNPFKDCWIGGIFEVGEDSYVVLCSSDFTNKLFCIDSDGNIKWINDSCMGSEWDFLFGESFEKKDGLVMVAWNKITSDRKIVHVNADTGVIEDAIVEVDGKTVNAYEVIGDQFYDLGDGRLIVKRSSSTIGDEVYHELDIVDLETYALKNSVTFVSRDGDDAWIQGAHANKDGTIVLIVSQNDGISKMFLLDVGFNTVKSVSLDSEVLVSAKSSRRELHFFSDGGFVVVHKTETISHDNHAYRIRRYDRYLNFLWELDLEANFVYYFHSPDGEMMAYRSMWGPERECYIDSYGSEDRFEIEHVHKLSYTKEVPATCRTEGMMKYWYCTDCGCYYYDEGVTWVLDPQSLRIPLGDHSIITIPATDPTCAKTGWTEETKCSSCGAVFIASASVPKSEEHTYETWTVVKEATRTTEGEERSVCSLCGKEEIRTIAKLEKSNEILWIVLITFGAASVVLIVCLSVRKYKKHNNI